MKKLVSSINRKLTDENLSGREAVRQIGIKSSTFYRILRGGGMRTENLLPVCVWLNVPFERFTTNYLERATFYEDGETLDKIEALIFADPDLEESDKQKLNEIFRAQYQVITNLGK